ncbi:MAG: tRNA (adenosine(37)-N6)-dimethylallyltransferase MiaA [Dinoroseobacter sp.]|nr:tRNA (adenosine(37)-N6)-dimethylallyltransferase MiaA [Dinoroseobacter sp.]
MIDLSRIPPDQPVLIAGPTASGKSALALEIAEAQGGVIVNADALQVYDCWQVLSARPSPEDQARAPHALYGHVERGETYSVGDWLREVSALKDGADRLIIVGGTGLYLSSLTEGISKIPAIPNAVRARGNVLRVEDFAQMKGELEARDPDLMARIDVNNPMRVQRGWEVLEATGTPLSVWQATKDRPLIPRDHATALVLEAPKEWLTPRIEHRFSAMIHAGALQEVQTNAPFWNASEPWSRAIGAAELMDYIAGKASLEDAIARATIATRQFAKRQRTWFRARMSTWDKIDANAL